MPFGTSPSFWTAGASHPSDWQPSKKLSFHETVPFTFFNSLRLYSSQNSVTMIFLIYIFIIWKLLSFVFNPLPDIFTWCPAELLMRSAEYCLINYSDQKILKYKTKLFFLHAKEPNLDITSRTKPKGREMYMETRYRILLVERKKISWMHQNPGRQC